MLKILIPVILIFTVSAIALVYFSRPKPEPGILPAASPVTRTASGNSPVPTEVPRSLPASTGGSSTDSALLATINDLSQKIGKLTALESKISNVEKTTDDLKNRVSSLESSSATSQGTSTTTTTTVAGNKSPQYIYGLGYGGSTTNSDWTEVSTLTLTIDPALYPGYSSMQLEALVRVKDGNGKVFARLYSGGTAVAESELSTESYRDVWIGGGAFSLGSKKTFTLQLKTLTGYEAYVSEARVKVNF